MLYPLYKQILGFWMSRIFFTIVHVMLSNSLLLIIYLDCMYSQGVTWYVSMMWTHSLMGLFSPYLGPDRTNCPPSLVRQSWIVPCKIILKRGVKWMTVLGDIFYPSLICLYTCALYILTTLHPKMMGFLEICYLSHLPHVNLQFFCEITYYQT